MRKYIPLLILLAVALGLLVFYGPHWYKSYLFRQAAGQFTSAVKNGDTTGWLGMVDPAQQARLQPHLNRLPPDYAMHISSFKLSRYERSGGDTIWAIFTCRLDDASGSGVYQGKLRWRWQNGRWEWDFLGSFAAPFSISGEPEWIKLEEMLRLAEAMQ